MKKPRRLTGADVSDKGGAGRVMAVPAWWRDQRRQLGGIQVEPLTNASTHNLLVLQLQVGGFLDGGSLINALHLPHIAAVGDEPSGL